MKTLLKFLVALGVVYVFPMAYAQVTPTGGTFTWPTITAVGTTEYLNLQAAGITTQYTVSVAPNTVAPATCTYRIEGSVDGVSWTTIDQVSPLSCASANTENFSSTPYPYIHVNVLTYSPGSGTGVVFSFNGVPASIGGASSFSQLSGTATLAQLPGSGVTTVNGKPCTLGASCTNTSTQLQSAIGSGVYDGSGAASTAQSNAEAYSSNASNLTSGTIDVSRLALPVPPAGAHLFANIQNTTGWIACAQACAGGALGITSIVQGVASPSLSGSAMQVLLTNQHAISTVTISAGGSGYVVGDVVTVTQSGASSGQLTVSTVSSGVVTALAVSSSSPGQFYSVANGLATTGGTGTGLTVNITAITGSANSLFYQKTLGCPTNIPLVSGNTTACDYAADVHILEDYYIYIPTTDAGIQAIENDPDIYDSTHEYFNSRQCDSASGMWRLWNMGTNSWITTQYPCPMLGQTGVWHHMVEYSVISRITGLSYYRSFQYDGTMVWHDLDQAFPPAALNSTTGYINFEVQLDLNAGAGTAQQSFYVDKMNAWVW